MRVLSAIVVPPHLSVSGGARAAEQLSAALSSRCVVTVASMMNGAGAGQTPPVAAGPRRLPVRTWLPPGLPWSRLPNRYSTMFYRSDLPDLVAGGDHDLAHLHNPMPAMELERVARACLARGLPYVISTHGFNEVANGTSIYGFDPARRLIFRQLVVAPVTRVVRRAAAVFALSEADTPNIRGMGYDGPITLVPNGVTLPDVGDEAADGAILKRMGIPAAKDPRQITCMFLANHTPNKGLSNLLAAFAKLDRPFRLIVGGEMRDGIDYAASIRGCRPCQEILVTGRLTDEQVSALFRRSDLFVFPTLADTFPLVVLEAMSHGVPVLASRVGGIPHQIDESCGVLVPPGDVEALAAAAASLIADPAGLAMRGHHARARVAAAFTWESAAARALAGYEGVLGARLAGTAMRQALGAGTRPPLPEAAGAE